MDTLSLNRFDVDGTTWLETIDEPRDLRIGAELPGWLRKAEFVVKPRNRRDEAVRRTTHHGNQVVIYDSRNYTIGRLWVRAIEPVDGGLRYICTGPWDRHDDSLYTTDFVYTDTVTAVLQTLLGLAGLVKFLEAPAGNFDSNSTTIKQWRVGNADHGGVLPVDAIPELLDMSDSLYARYDYWCQPGAVDHLYPAKDQAYYRKRDETAAPEWILGRHDLARGGVDLSSNIYDYANNVTVFFGWLHGTATNSGAFDGSTWLFDSATAAGFGPLGVVEGATVWNLTTGKEATVLAVDDTNKRLLCGAGDNSSFVFNSGDDYAITVNGETSAYQTPTYWGRQIHVHAMTLNQTQAAQLAAMLAVEKNAPVLQRSFTVGASQIRHRSGALRPLWHLLLGPATILIDDLEPSMVTLDTWLDERNSFWPVRVDFDYRTMSARITPTDPGDFDTLLGRAGVSPGGISINSGDETEGRRSDTSWTNLGAAGLEMTGFGKKLLSELSPAQRAAYEQMLRERPWQ